MAEATQVRILVTAGIFYNFTLIKKFLDFSFETKIVLHLAIFMTYKYKEVKVKFNCSPAYTIVFCYLAEIHIG